MKKKKKKQMIAIRKEPYVYRLYQFIIDLIRKMVLIDYFCVCHIATLVSIWKLLIFSFYKLNFVEKKRERKSNFSHKTLTQTLHEMSDTALFDKSSAWIINRLMIQTSSNCNRIY